MRPPRAEPPAQGAAPPASTCSRRSVRRRRHFIPDGAASPSSPFHHPQKRIITPNTGGSLYTRPKAERPNLPCPVVKEIVGEKPSVNRVFASFLIHSAPPAVHGREGFGRDQGGRGRAGSPPVLGVRTSFPSICAGTTPASA